MQLKGQLSKVYLLALAVQTIDRNKVSKLLFFSTLFYHIALCIVGIVVHASICVVVKKTKPGRCSRVRSLFDIPLIPRRA